jgi:hypothetical protein
MKARICLTVLMLVGAVVASACSRDPYQWERTQGADGGLRAKALGGGHEVHLSGLRRLDCKDCHEFKAAVFAKPKQANCERCHESIAVRIHRGPEGSPQTVCLTCHTFVSRDAAASNLSECMGCHNTTQDMSGGPHDPLKPLDGHKHVPEIRVHAKEACNKCHMPHRDVPTKAAECLSCHVGERTARHRIHGKANSQACDDCHRPHESGIGLNDRCASCHSDHVPIVPATALFEGGHTACISCHESSPVKNCVVCHAKHTLGEQKPAHANCISCHVPHAGRTRPTAAVCLSCHGNQRLSHPVDTGRGCLDCHAVHGQPAFPPSATRCTQCHKNAATDTALHAGGLGCRQCHKPHGEGAIRNGTRCGTCHQRQNAMVSRNAGHSDCVKCHTPHAPKQAIPQCTSCHGDKAKTATQGHHSDCRTCHDPHEGKPSSGSPCLACHKGRVGGPHGRLPRGCPTCHHPHDGAMVMQAGTCTACHPIARLAALHQVPQHQACGRCHTPHTAPRSDRATCTTTCHETYRQHELKAVSCAACHVFGGAR